jgi:hypothetical protein
MAVISASPNHHEGEPSSTKEELATGDWRHVSDEESSNEHGGNERQAFYNDTHIYII